mgnify:CR=1 FL=1
MVRFFYIFLFFVAACQLDTKEFDTISWTDDFSGDHPDNSKWTLVTGNGCPELCGFGNNELQYYTDHTDNVRIEDGVLVIEARKDSMGTNAFTSAKLISKGKGDWRTGRIEVRAKLPTGKGTWPAIWMLPTLNNREMNWPEDGEIDIMEHVGYNEGWIYGTIHTEKYNHVKGTQRSDSIYVENAANQFHTYAIDWSEKEIKWFVDDELYNKIERNGEGKEGWPFDGRFHLIINLAVGGNWGGKYGVAEDIWPQRFEIDYVRVYQ